MLSALILAPFAEHQLDRLREVLDICYESWLDTRQLHDPDLLAARLETEGTAILVVESDFLFEEVFQQAPKLQLVGVCRNATGHVDVDAQRQIRSLDSLVGDHRDVGIEIAIDAIEKADPRQCRLELPVGEDRLSRIQKSRLAPAKERLDSARFEHGVAAKLELPHQSTTPLDDMEHDSQFAVLFHHLGADVDLREPRISMQSLDRVGGVLPRGNVVGSAANVLQPELDVGKQPTRADRVVAPDLEGDLAGLLRARIRGGNLPDQQ